LVEICFMHWLKFVGWLHRINCLFLFRGVLCQTMFYGGDLTPRWTWD
jgi:hypothetical protein